MLTRRSLLTSIGALGAVAAAPPLLSGCARHPSSAPSSSSPIALADARRYLGGARARPAVISSLQAFSSGLYRQIGASTAGNVVCAPHSVAESLAMTRNGAQAETASQMDDVLGITDLERYNEGMDSLALLLRSRAGEVKNGVGAKATVTIDIANSLWGQRGARWEQPFLEALARYYGTGLHLVDYIKASERARSLINAWVATQTHDKIPALIPAGVLDAFTRLVLVNAISFKAPWDMQFHPHQTKQRPFTLADGRRVMVETMRGKIYVPVTQSSRWRAGRLPYAGGRLAMTIVVPTISLQDLESSLDGAALRAMLDPHAKRQRVEFSLPTWRFRLSSRLDDALSALGMPIAFSSSADFSGMTKQDDLRIGAVQHEAYISVDEKGTEAAAATAVVAELLSLAPPPPAFTVDRPFLFVIHDVESTAPLFIGRVTDPTAGDA